MKDAGVSFLDDDAHLWFKKPNFTILTKSLAAAIRN
jgi:hypothetical protein